MDLHTQPRIRVEASAWIFFSLLTLLLPLNWVLSALAAAAVHELCHILALELLSVGVYGLRISSRGAVLDTAAMTVKQELSCALAGPVGSFCLFLMIRFFPRIGICAMLQGLYNLLPLGNLDGGRALRCAIRLLPGKSPCKQGKIGVQ